MKLYLHDYEYMPYEKEFAKREVMGLLRPKEMLEKEGFFNLVGKFSNEDIRKLVYFSKAQKKTGSINTFQFELEQSSVGNNSKGARRRQATRYSVHGLHEYKGKFNPQVVRGILNSLGVGRDSAILDPFCGSGTTLVECFNAGMPAIGCDINPLATFVANAKIDAIGLAFGSLKKAVKRVVERVVHSQEGFRAVGDERTEYLNRWFHTHTLLEIENLRKSIMEERGRSKNILLVVGSDLLRDYSLQEPGDLRIRRRKTPLPEEPFLEAFERKCKDLLQKTAVVQQLTSKEKHPAQAYTFDIRCPSEGPKKWVIKPPFDAAITSPPYATALPYIDTQRLSLVWLDFCKPSEILPLEAALIGSREFRGGDKHEWSVKLRKNENEIPKPLLKFCLELQNAIGPEDGFRRRAKPLLLYRYLADMQKMFANVSKMMRRHAPFALIVGYNHTILGGKRFDIDTPAMLAELAQSMGWIVEETVPLQTYKRYGINKKNSVASETLLILRWK